MKTNMRKGFTLIELLVVMTIIAILAGISVDRLSSSKKAAYITSMKNDMRNAINVMESYYVEHGDYGSYNFSAGDSSDGTRDGYFTRDELKFPLSKGNSVQLYSNYFSFHCDDGDNGYRLYIKNSKVKDKKVTYDSCEDTAPKIEDI